MSRPDSDERPLPDEIVIVAYPDAYSSSRGKATPDEPACFFVVTAAPADIRITPPSAPWLSMQPPSAMGSGFSRIDYQAATNPRQARQLDVNIAVRHRNYRLRFRQAGGELAQKEMLALLNAPLNLDFLVAITYVAGLIKKVQPPPLKLIVIVVAVLAIIALGFAIAMLRHAFAGVPEPPPLSTDCLGIPIPLFPGVDAPLGLLPLPAIAVEDQVIALQTLRQLYWLLKQVQ